MVQEELLPDRQPSIVNPSKSNLAGAEDDDFFKENEKDKIKFEFERIRFSIPYMIYQRMNQWPIIDSITLNFHLLTATVTVVLCTNW